MTKTNTGSGNQAGKEGDPPSAMKKTNFVCKDIVKKKRNPQPILTKFFPITKKAMAVRVPKNFQGFPLHECEKRWENMFIGLLITTKKWRRRRKELRRRLVSAKNAFFVHVL
jgi:hypothetical protein